MSRTRWAKMMCVRLGLRTLLPLLFAIVAFPPAASAQLLEGPSVMERWADSTVGLSSSKWAGPRVPFPAPRARPVAPQRLDSASLPLSVHAGLEVDPARLALVLDAAEATHELLAAAGFLTSFGDAGQGGTAGRDLFLVEAWSARDSASSALDATGNFSALDGGRAYALVDQRVPSERLFACTAQALIDAQLFELDPAEAASVRAGSAAYFATLVAGDSCDDAVLEPSQNPFLAANASSAGAWFERLSQRQDQNRGTFLFDMWQFARQRTWEGQDLRASPDLFETIDKSLELARESFPLVVAELAETLGRTHPELVFALTWQALPAFTPKTQPALGVLGSKHVHVALEGPRAGERLRAWARGEAGGRYVLSALRLDHKGQVLSRLELEPRRDPTSQLSIELDDRTASVLISVTRYADEGLPDPDRFALEDRRPVQLTIDRGE